MNSNTTAIDHINIQNINTVAQNDPDEYTTIVSLSNNTNNNYDNNNNNNNPHHNLIIEETIEDDDRRLSTNSTTDDTANIIQDNNNKPVPNTPNIECITVNVNDDQHINNVINKNNNDNNNYTKNINNNYDNLASEILGITKPALTTTTTTNITTPSNYNNMLSKSESTTTTTPTTVQQNINSQYQQQTVENCVSIVSVNIIIGSVLIIGIVFLWYYMGWYYGVPAILVAFIIILITSGVWHWLYIAILTAPRDMRALRRYIQLLGVIKQYQSKNLSVNDVFQTNVSKHPEKACLMFEDRPWTFRKVNEFSNRIANLFQQHGYKTGDAIALFMENRPEFVCIWLGLSKIGVIVPLINTNLRQATLLHSISAANCKAVIFGESLRPGVDEIAKSLPSTLHLYQYNDESMINRNGMSLIVHDLAQLMTPCSKENVVYNDKDKHHNKLLYIYTSGTTGMPKAAVITTSRYLFIASAIHILASFKRTDTFYTPLPLYHTAAGMMCVGQALVFGCTVVIRKKFSASNYFSDCIKYKCTVAQYIGEMCRYILATPKSTSDTGHNVRLIFGNGLRPQIWPEFVKRFNIPLVAEFYGATEGNASIVNVDNTVGAIGFISRIIPSVYPISVIRCDENTGEPIRGSNGLCQKCEPNEPGVFIGKIVPGNPSRAFLGYVDQAASEKKIIKNIFKKGDSAFLSGDIVVADNRGNLFFKDRTGDTYRWKGENVSTSEVEGQLNITAGYRDTIVYGVEIPNTDGRAGMAAILDIDRTLDLYKFANDLKTALPSYARPIFVRLLNSVDLTGTFKLKKIDLQLEGFNPNIIADRLYYLTSNGNYKLLDSTNYELICNGGIRF